jgi:hypothetical protein
MLARFGFELGTLGFTLGRLHFDVYRSPHLGWFLSWRGAFQLWGSFLPVPRPLRFVNRRGAWRAGRGWRSYDAP